jgi:hypothetical protein
VIFNVTLSLYGVRAYSNEMTQSGGGTSRCWIYGERLRHRSSTVRTFVVDVRSNTSAGCHGVPNSLEIASREGAISIYGSYYELT